MDEERKLRTDIESYLRGEQPPADAKAERLEHWTPRIACGSTGAYAMTLCGHWEGGVVETGDVVWLDRRGRWARTQRRLWLLGEPEGREIPLDGVDV